MKKLFLRLLLLGTVAASVSLVSLPVLADSFKAAPPAGPLPFTGDNAPLNLMWILIGVGLLVIVGLVISMRKK